jgi:GNAT superfamily N-acetyltransferase
MSETRDPNAPKLGSIVLRVDVTLIRRLEAVIDSFALARLEALAEAGNAFDLRIARFGDSVAPAAPDAPELDFVNRISLSPFDGERVEEILDHYEALGVRPWLEPSPEVELALPRGVELLGSQAVLYATATAVDCEGPAVREASDHVGVARLLLQAFGAPGEAVETNAAPLAVAAERCGGRFYTVEIDARPAAAAILTVCGNDAYLAMAGTLPEFRGCGCQAALIRARIAEAAASGCKLVVATAAFPSSSHRNLERCGLRTAYTKPVLRLAPR